MAQGTHPRIACPRDRARMRETPLGEAVVDVCGKCFGTFFASGAIFLAAGIAADPSSWDRPETGGAVKNGTLPCPSCERVKMDAQDIDYGGKHVEIDRCGKCGGIWLDKDELDTIVAIGTALRPVIDAERAKAEAELAAMGEPVLKPTAAYKRRALIALVVAVAIGGYGTYAYYDAKHEAMIQRNNVDKKEGGGCPCGCDHSKVMAAELRAKGKDEATKEIAATLVTIAERENAGYITERMIQHRLRMLDVARELGSSVEHRAVSAERCALTPTTSPTLRMCPELAVNGERTETVLGKPKLLGSSYRLWLEIENLTSEEQHLEPPSFDAGAVHFPVSRWYEEGTAGEPWSGVLRAHETIRVDVIGDIPDHLKPGVPVMAAITLGDATMSTSTSARADIHLTRLDPL